MANHPQVALSHFYHTMSRNKYRRRLRDGVKPLPKNHILDTEWREAFAAQKTNGRQPVLSIKDAASRYQETILPATRISTQHQRVWRNYILRFMDLVGEDMPVHEITESHLSDYRDTLITRGMKNSSINRCMETIYTLLTSCRDNWRIIDKAPRLTHFKGDRRLRYISSEEERMLVDNAPIHLARLIRFILGTGARKSEALNLCWDDVTFPPDKRSRAWIKFPTTKNGKAHAVPLPPSIKAMLKEMYKERFEGMPYVFTYVPRRDYRLSDGRLMLAQGIPAPYIWPDPDFRTLRIKVNLLDVTLHDLRHTYASRLVMSGVPIFQVARLLNHSSVEETMKYAHLSKSHLEECVDVLDTIQNAEGSGPYPVMMRAKVAAPIKGKSGPYRRQRDEERVMRLVGLTKKLRTKKAK